MDANVGEFEFVFILGSVDFSCKCSGCLPTRFVFDYPFAGAINGDRVMAISTLNGNSVGLMITRPGTLGDKQHQRTVDHHEAIRSAMNGEISKKSTSPS